MNDVPSLDAVLRAAHAVEAAIEERMQAVGLSGAKFMALKVLAEAGDPIPLGQLAERLQCVKSNITQLVDRLEADGLVERQSDPRDRRARLATLTKAGTAAMRAGRTAMAAAEHDVFGGLTGAEARQLRALVGKVGARE
jgi:DNA-binding MarR family transcriptional regulator